MSLSQTHTRDRSRPKMRAPRPTRARRATRARPRRVAHRPSSSAAPHEHRLTHSSRADRVPRDRESVMAAMLSSSAALAPGARLLNARAHGVGAPRVRPRRARRRGRARRRRRARSRWAPRRSSRPPRPPRARGRARGARGHGRRRVPATADAAADATAAATAAAADAAERRRIATAVATPAARRYGTWRPPPSNRVQVRKPATSSASETHGHCRLQARRASPPARSGRAARPRRACLGAAAAVGERRRRGRRRPRRRLGGAASRRRPPPRPPPRRRRRGRPPRLFRVSPRRSSRRSRPRRPTSSRSPRDSDGVSAGARRRTGGDAPGARRAGRRRAARMYAGDVNAFVLDEALAKDKRAFLVDTRDEAQRVSDGVPDLRGAGARARRGCRWTPRRGVCAEPNEGAPRAARSSSNSPRRRWRC